MYELYDKDGKFICYRMTKRIKNSKGEYDVLTARSKKSEKECRKIMDDKIRDYYIHKEAEKHKGVFPDMLFKDFADNWYELNVKNADCSQVNKNNYKNYVYTHIIPYFANYKLCEIHEDDCQRFLNQYAWHNFCREMDIANGATVYRNQITKSTLAPDLEPYLLRHTFCTDCQTAGVPLNVAKELMGHSDISVTAKIYTHMVDEVFEQNRKRLAEYANQKEQKAVNE